MDLLGKYTEYIESQHKGSRLILPTGSIDFDDFIDMVNNKFCTDDPTKSTEWADWDESDEIHYLLAVQFYQKIVTHCQETGQPYKLLDQEKKLVYDKFNEVLGYEQSKK